MIGFFHACPTRECHCFDALYWKRERLLGKPWQPKPSIYVPPVRTNAIAGPATLTPRGVR